MKKLLLSIFLLYQLLFGQSSIEKGRAYAQFTYGMYLVSNGESEKAKEHFDVSAKLDSTNGRVHLHRGDIFFTEGDFVSAERCYLAANAIEPRNPLILYNLACVQSRQGKVAPAIEAIRNAISVGYNRFEKFETDSDLKATRDDASWAEFKETMRSIEMSTGGGALLVLSPEKERIEILSSGLESNPSKVLDLARVGVFESRYEVRLLSFLIILKSDADVSEKSVAVARGAFDSNGYVQKAVARWVVTEGREYSTIYKEIVDSGDEHAAFIGRQVLAKIGNN